MAVASGMGLTLIVNWSVPEHPLASVTVTEYVPALATVTLLIVGFCAFDVNPPGPVQL